MAHVEIDGATLEYHDTGAGDPVILIHGALVADAFRPLRIEPSLSDNHRLVSYHRRGYAGSAHSPEPISIERQALDCRALLNHLNVERAHVVGHSLGGSIALQFARDFPDAVHSLALLEPAYFGDATGQTYRAGLTRARERYREAGAETAVDEFLVARCPGYAERLRDAVPGAFAQAVADAETFFEQEIPALQSWAFAESELRRIQQPTLAVLGGASEVLQARFAETHELLLTWLPHAEELLLIGTTHFMLIEEPRLLAEALAAFYARHPLHA
jgi:pimeloyl-ACP methyl ester carboxylesterase